jgi:enoyl-CoA hydratase/carnithine racemase
MQYEQILYEQSGPVLTLTMNRPEALNALTRQMRRELCHAIDRGAAEDAVRAIVITGAGRAFCAGADLSGGAAMFDPSSEKTAEDEAEAGRDGAGILALKLFACTKPLIAAVNGPAIGVGATMLLPMDVRLAADAARFGFVFARRGILTDGCASWFLPRVVGISQALDWGLSGRVFSALEAFQAGLVMRVTQQEELLAKARECALEIANNCAPVSVALMRQLMWRMLGADHPIVAHRLESRFLASRGPSADAREGVASFKEKRKAIFADRVSSDMPPEYPWWSDEIESQI